MKKCLPRDAFERIRGRFERLYGPALAPRCADRAAMLVGRYGVGGEARAARPRWSESDALLIAYGDMIRCEAERPLAALRRFVDKRLDRAFSMVHVLPFFPYSSDEGFSVTSYRTVNPELGRWEDIRALSQSCALGCDLVLNHASRQHSWFRDYALGIDPYRGYFLEADPSTDLSAVVRPRTTPLLSQVHTREGGRWVWTTFSADQVDLNFANPDVLFEFLDILFFYIANGARLIRLDAVAFLWKRPGTSCLHLPETHEIVKLMRDMIEVAAPDVILLTETNVPHRENVSYFGEGDEAHMVYQFALPPLLLHGLLSGSAAHFSAWAAGLDDPPPGCTFLNFTASHDGIGLRPLEGLAPDGAVEWLAAETRRGGGQVSSRATAGGAEAPYELNITYHDALAFPGGGTPELHLRRFLCSQAVPLALKGVPAVYFNSLLAAPNDIEGARLAGHPRAINRHRWTEPEIEALLVDHQSPAANAFAGLLRLVRLRARHPAFHPDARQRVCDCGGQIFCVERTSPDGSERILCAHNFTGTQAGLDLAEPAVNLLGAGAGTVVRGRLELEPYGLAWLGVQAE